MSAAAPRKEKVTAAFKIITSDPNVKGILVNIFGGIMRCDVIAEGVVAAVKEVGLRGAAGGAARRHQRRRSARRSSPSPNLNVTSADDLDDAAQKIVKAVKEAGVMSILDRQEHQGHLPGLHRQERHLPFRSRRSPTAPRWSAARRRAKAAPPISTCRCSTPSPRRSAQDRLRRQRDLRAARRRGATRSARRSRPRSR